jgi:hypothetical protein
MDEADAFWAANLLTYFTDEVLRAIVATGQISDPEAANYLTETLIKRRDKCIRYWIRQTNPLDRFAVNADGSEVTFDNAALRAGAGQGTATYKVQWSALDNLKNEERTVGGEAGSSSAKLAIPKDAWGPKDDANFRYTVARIRTVHADNPQWQEPVVLTIRDKGGKYDVVGLQRPRHDPKIETKVGKEKAANPVRTQTPCIDTTVVITAIPTVVVVTIIAPMMIYINTAIVSFFCRLYGLCGEAVAGTGY